MGKLNYPALNEDFSQNSVLHLVTDTQMRPTPNDYRALDTSHDRNMKIIDGALVIKNIQKSHEGYYLCKASNGIGGISAVAKIAVQGNNTNE